MICLWCSRNDADQVVSFYKKAHTIPQALGGRFICDNVCDGCNHYFGSPGMNKVAIEVVLREAFELTRHMVFSGADKKGNHYNRFKSIFFKLNKQNRTFSFKQIYTVRPGFQAMMARQFKRGLFKIFLEEYQRQLGEGQNARYDFMREFARFDLGDYPVYYMVPKLPVLYYDENQFIEPRLNFTEPQQVKLANFEFYIIMIFGHSFLIPTYRNWELSFDGYIRDAKNNLSAMYRAIKPIHQFRDVDFTCSFMDFEGSAWDR